MTLRELLEKLPDSEVHGDTAVSVSSLTCDSRAVIPGALFFALRGEQDFFLIPTALGVCFFLIWAFIGGMILRDGQLAVQRDLDSDGAILPMPMYRRATSSKSGQPTKRLVRIAS